MGRKRISEERNDEICKEVIEILKQNLRKDICLCNLIEEKIDLSNERIRKIFRNAKGVSIFKYHDNLVLKHAYKLLQNNACFYVSLELGFNDGAYFCNWFKNKCQISPTSYKINNHFSQPNITRLFC